MRKEILTNKQLKLLPLIKSFSKDFGLVGGTALALQIGYRQSVDFDLFTNKKFNNAQIRKKILENNKKISHVFYDQEGEYTILIDNVKFTFFYYPFKINFSKKFEDIIKISDILTLSAMKAYALGRRAKWKDYIDLYFIFKNYYNINQLVKKTKQIFKSEFNEKIFRTQLGYFKDIDYSEKVIYTKGFKVENEIIKKELIKISLS